MKKLIFMVLVMLSTQIFAQDTTKPTTDPATTTTTTTTTAPPPATTTASDAEVPSRRFGIYGGVNFASINGDTDADSKTGYQFGIMFRVINRNIFSLWLQPGYTSVGAETSSSGTSGAGKIDLGYIMIPIVARLQTDIGLYGDIGVQTQFLVNAKGKVGGSSIDIKDDVNGFDWGGLIGAGFEFRKRLGISVRYYAGFSNINDDDLSDSKDHLGVFSILAHVRL